MACNVTIECRMSAIKVYGYRLSYKQVRWVYQAGQPMNKFDGFIGSHEPQLGKKMPHGKLLPPQQSYSSLQFIINQLNAAYLTYPR